MRRIKTDPEQGFGLGDDRLGVDGQLDRVVKGIGAVLILAAGIGPVFENEDYRLLIGGYVLSMGLGAVTAPALAKRLGEFGALAVAACLVALGYGLNVVSHGSVVGLLVNMMIAGIGSGALVAALPVAAAGAAPAAPTAHLFAGQ